MATAERTSRQLYRPPGGPARAPALRPGGCTSHPSAPSAVPVGGRRGTVARNTARLVAWIVALILGGSLAACGGDEHKDHKDHQTGSGSGK